MGYTAKVQRVRQWTAQVGSSDELTLYIDKIPARCKKAELLLWLDESGFRDTYDYFYLPRCFSTGKSKGYAFINFFVPEVAPRFLSAVEVADFGDGPSLTVKLSATQGLEANMARWARSRSRRVRDPEVLPYVRSLDASDVVPSTTAREHSTSAPMGSEVPAPSWLSRSGQPSSTTSQCGTRRSSFASDASTGVTDGAPGAESAVVCCGLRAWMDVVQGLNPTTGLDSASVIVLHRFSV